MWGEANSTIPVWLEGWGEWQSFCPDSGWQSEYTGSIALSPGCLPGICCRPVTTLAIAATETHTLPWQRPHWPQLQEIVTWKMPNLHKHKNQTVHLKARNSAVKKEAQWKKKHTHTQTHLFISSWILRSCEPHRIICTATIHWHSNPHVQAMVKPWLSHVPPW